MYIRCNDNDGFEDQLTTSTLYEVMCFGTNGYLIVNDRNQERWYGTSKFICSTAWGG